MTDEKKRPPGSWEEFKARNDRLAKELDYDFRNAGRNRSSANKAAPAYTSNGSFVRSSLGKPDIH